MNTVRSELAAAVPHTKARTMHRSSLLHFGAALARSWLVHLSSRLLELQTVVSQRAGAHRLSLAAAAAAVWLLFLTKNVDLKRLHAENSCPRCCARALSLSLSLVVVCVSYRKHVLQSKTFAHYSSLCRCRRRCRRAGWRTQTRGFNRHSHEWLRLETIHPLLNYRYDKLLLFREKTQKKTNRTTGLFGY